MNKNETLELIDYATKGGLFFLVDHERRVWIVSTRMIPTPDKIKRNGSWTSKDLEGEEFTDGHAARNRFDERLKSGQN